MELRAGPHVQLRAHVKAQLELRLGARTHIAAFSWVVHVGLGALWGWNGATGGAGDTAGTGAHVGRTSCRLTSGQHVWGRAAV